MDADSFLSIAISKTYPEFLLQTNLTVEKGEFFSLLGPSGCGKTTLLRLIAGLEQPDQGNISLKGVDITRLPPGQRRIGLVFQDYALFPHLNVSANIGYGLKNGRMSSVESKKRVGELLELFELTNLAQRPVQQLSGGEQQRVAIARALAPQPELLLLDEPFSALDYALRRRLRRDLLQYQRLLGITTIFVSHHQEEALAISDRIGLMQDGKILQTGTPTAVYQDPVNRFACEFLGEANLIPCRVIDRSASGSYRIEWAEGFGFNYPAGKQKLANSRYTLMVRTEDVLLSDSTEQGLIGTVTACEYLGPATRLEVWVNGITFKILSGKAAAKLKPGDAARISFAWDQVRFLPADF